MKLSALLKGVKTLNAFEEREVERVTDKDYENLNNSLFVCINGKSVDGHALAKKAVENGATAILTDRDLQISRQIIVEDTRKAFALIAANFYGNPAKKLKIIGITGTNGKTSTSIYIKDILKNMGVSCGVIGTVKNSWEEFSEESVLTTPEPMQLQKIFYDMVEAGCEYCVMEVSSQALAQHRVHGIHFIASAVTNITPEHLDYHKNMENYIGSKLMLSTMSDCICVNIDDENITQSMGRIGCPLTTYSALSDNADYTAKNVVCNESGVKYELVGIDCISRIKTKNLGIFTVYNTLCAASVLLKIGFSIDEIAEAIQKLSTVSGRAEIVDIDAPFTVMIDYAHTPDGLYNILCSLREITKGRIITVFGCGGDRDKSKRCKMGSIAGQYSDIAVVTSDNPRTENPLLIINDILCGMEKSKSKIAVIENRRQAIEFALKKARKGDVVLLAGKGHETYQIIGNSKIHFDEREVVREYFKS